MQNNEKPFVLAAILFVITAVVALLLACSNSITKDLIAQNTAKEQDEARRAVMTEAVSFEKEETEAVETEIVKEIYRALDESGETMGYCVSVAPNGFGGAIEMMVGVKTDETLTGITVISLSETPGLGSKAQTPDFQGQFTGKSVSEPLSVIKSGTAKEDEIAAISGATISSNAVTKGVNAAAEAVKRLQKEVG